MRPRQRTVSSLLFLLLSLTSLNARVVRVELTSRADLLNGTRFGDVGAYERMAGRVYFAVSVGSPHNRRIVDLDKAVNLKNGEVEFSADFIAIRPKDPHKGNGAMLLENPNRGHSRILSLIDGGDWDAAKDGGDGWLLRHGFTFVSLGWQWDAAGGDALKLYAPVAKDHGKTITGLLRGDLMPSKPMPEIPLGHLIIGNIGGTEYPVSAPEDPRNVLTVRDSRDAQPTSSVFFPTDIFPFTDLPEKDPVTGETGGLLDRAVADKVAPKIFFSNTSYEYWGRACALIHVSADGKQDAPISDSVRIYHFTGEQHFPGPWPPAKGEGDLRGQQPESPLAIRYFWRAMVANMDAWVRSGTLPPASSYPRIADGTLVPLHDYAFPPLPGVKKPHEANAAYRLDFGPNWRDGILSIEPPKVGEAFPILVPQVDVDGNERDGVRMPEISVPLATYASWNLRDPSIGAPDQRVSFEDSYIPFPRTAAEKQKNGDPRRSIEERYGSREEYVARYSKAVDDLIQQRWILPEDREAVLTRGEQEWAQATQ
jgi:hypothetical protein